MKKINLSIFICGLIIILSTVALSLLHYNPQPVTMPNDRGFSSAIIWLELIENSAELDLIFGQKKSQRKIELKETIIKLSYLDFLYMTLYSVFFLGLIKSLLHFDEILNKKMKGYVLFSSLILCLSMFIFDIFETKNIIAIVKTYDATNVSTLINDLGIFTRIKWISIFFASLIIGLLYLFNIKKKKIAVLGALLYLLSSTIGFISFYDFSLNYILEISNIFLIGGWLFSTIDVGYRALRRKEGSN